MQFLPLFTLTSTLASTVLAGYTLEDDYLSAGFFDQFTFWDEDDPTNGFVQYQNRSSAEDIGLIQCTSDNAKMSVDSTNITPDGRPSVRITSKKAYNYGLIVADIEHMPGGICGSWPAFWAVGPDWPHGGEIDIFEGVNDQLTNFATLHTGPDCSMTDNGGFTGNLTHANCASSGEENTGCQVVDDNSNTYGVSFNANGGGVYATEWTSSCITIWFFPRGSIPADVLGDAPDPSSWGTPNAKFQGDCDISKSFVDQRIVFDTTFCGDWADGVWPSSTCAQKYGNTTCSAYVSDNPTVFTDAYWSINALKVYTEDAAAPTLSISPYEVTSTSIHYVTQPATGYASASEMVSYGTTLPMPTKPTGYAPVVSPPESVYVVSTASPSVPSSAGYAPVVGTDGVIGYDAEAAPSQAGGDWSTEDGVMVYHGVKKRHARHLGHHKRHGGGRL